MLMYQLLDDLKKPIGVYISPKEVTKFIELFGLTNKEFEEFSRMCVLKETD